MAIKLADCSISVDWKLAEKAFVFTDKRFLKHATAIGQGDSRLELPP